MKVNCALLSLAGVVFGDDYHADLKKSNTKRYDARYEEKTSEYWQKISKNDIYDSLKKKRIEKSYVEYKIQLMHEWLDTILLFH